LCIECPLVFLGVLLLRPFNSLRHYLRGRASSGQLDALWKGLILNGVRLQADNRRIPLKLF
jgi:hypothetical protein